KGQGGRPDPFARKPSAANEPATLSGAMAIQAASQAHRERRTGAIDGDYKTPRPDHSFTGIAYIDSDGDAGLEYRAVHVKYADRPAQIVERFHHLPCILEADCEFAANQMENERFGRGA